MALSADQAQPTIFTLTISSPYAFPADGPQHLTLFYDRGMQGLAGLASGSSIAVPLDASNFPQFLHGFTAGRSMLIAEGPHPAYSVNLTGSSAAVSALGQCTEAEGFTQLPPPWHAAGAAADNAATDASTGTQSVSSALGASTAPPPNETAEGASAPAVPSAPADSTDSPGDGGISPILIGILVVIGALVAWRVVSAVKRRQEAEARDREELRRQQRARQLIRAEIGDQAARLGIRRSQLVFNDFYGTPDLSKWRSEKEKFCATRIVPLLDQEGLAYLWPSMFDDVLYQIEQAALANSDKPSVAPSFISDPAVFDPRMDPIDYERHCALLLRESGWSTILTAATGDQGADVIAEKGSVRLVIQCKLYGQPVGNGAVQEAFAAKNFQKAQLAAVVSNAPFTPSARQLAMTTGVLLLHHEELRTLEIENIYGGGERGLA